MSSRCTICDADWSNNQFSVGCPGCYESLKANDSVVEELKVSNERMAKLLRIANLKIHKMMDFLLTDEDRNSEARNEVVFEDDGKIVDVFVEGILVMTIEKYKNSTVKLYNNRYITADHLQLILEVVQQINMEQKC